VYGEDRQRLIHAMSTNDVKSLQPGQGCYAFFLSAQGRILSDVTIFALEHFLLLDVEPAQRKPMMEHLDKFIIADDVRLEDSSDQQTTLAIEGPAARDILDAIDAPVPANDYDIVDWADRHIVKTSYTGAGGYHIYLNPMDAPILRENLQDTLVAPASDDEVETARILYARPLYGVDITDANLPQETQLTHALHFSKGCYLGQEIVERIRSRGHVNKVLTRLEYASDAPAPEGTITSSTLDPRNNKMVALGYVRR
jgi:tRNA-modifying protein YgfZ